MLRMRAAAARGSYVYAYPQYGYPGQVGVAVPPMPPDAAKPMYLMHAYNPQHMMPGMAPPPPGMYAPGPFMQPMPYAPGMPPPNGKWFVVVGR